MSKLNTIVFLVRHGDIDNPEKIIYGQNIDLPLNNKGRQQMLDLARVIEHMGHRPTKIFSSPLSRAVDSAKILLEFFRISKSNFIIDERLADNYIPVFAGKPIAELTKLHKKGIDEYDDRFVNKGNESKKDIIDRMHASFQSIIKENLGKVIVVISHGDPLRLLMFKLANKELKLVPLSNSKEFEEVDYLKKGESWRLVVNNELEVVGRELIKPELN